MKRVKHNCATEKGISKIDKNDSNFSRLYYVCYADDFLFGYVGLKKTANDIYLIVEKFLKDRLFLIVINRKLVFYRSQHIKYLGTLIHWQPNCILRTKDCSLLVTKSEIVALNRLSLTASISDIFKRFY